MLRRSLLFLICAVVCLGLVSSGFGAPTRPNVVIFFSDDQGTLDARCYGSEDLHTPNMDRLAASGVRFTQAYAHTVCCPSRAALLTGRHPQRGGVNDWTQGDMHDPEKGINMALEEFTLAEAMAEAGYRTALFGKWHLGSHRDHGPKRQGFDEFFGIRDGFIDNYNHYFLQGDGFHDLYEGTEEVWAEGKYFPRMMVDRAVQFLEENRERPFFLYLPFNTPHYPEQPRPGDLALYPDLAEPRRRYAAFVSTTDALMGEVIDQLEELGLRENTIVIFMSDNGHQSYENDTFFRIKGSDHNSGYPEGHEFGAYGGPSPGGGNTGKWIGHKGTFFEGGVRVPAIISWPAGMAQGVVREQAVTVMDWFPTVLELCGIPLPPVKLDGRSLVAVIESAEAPSLHPVIYFQWQNRWAVRRGDWKLIRNKGRRAQAPETFSLHNLADEEPEVVDYVEEQPGIVTELKELQARWSADVFGE